MKKVEQSISNNCCHCAENKGFTAVKRRDYAGLIFSPLSIELDSTILTGSVLEQKIKVQQVTVEKYQDGFDPNAGFTEDDWTITFE